MADNKTEFPLLRRSAGYRDLRELIECFEEMGELSRVDGENHKP